MKHFELTEEVVNKWQEVIESSDAPELKTATARRNMTTMLEVAESELGEAAVNNATNAGSSANWDPVLISMIRRVQPSLTTAGLVGVQPMTGPTGLIFAMRTYYHDPSDGTKTETWAQAQPNKDWSGPYSTADGENLGNTDLSPTPLWNQMSFDIQKTSVEAKTRALKATFTTELKQDLKAIHGLDAETILSQMLSAEIVAEIDREILGEMLTTAVPAGDYDMDADNDGRWLAEKAAALAIHIDVEAAKIARGTRRGKGNFIVTSANVAAALNTIDKVVNNFGLGDTPAPDATGLAYVGNLRGSGMKVYVDQYAFKDYVLVGYKGANDYDAGIYYCPYVALEYLQTVTERGFQPVIGFKTRYGLKENPFAQYEAPGYDETNSPLGDNGLGKGNQYFRYFEVKNMPA